jgi:ABC-2 type transport system permease protein
MRVIWAMFRASWLSAVSYRVSTVFQLVSLLVGIIPMFFITRALQDTMGNAIRNEGGNYFAFVLIGLVTVTFVAQGLNSLPGAVGGAVSSGTLDTLLTAPVSPVTIFAGLTAYGYVWTGIRAVITIGAGAALGAHVALIRVPAAFLILVLVILAYVPFGMMSAAMVVAFRTPGPLASGVLLASNLLGGVYYPTSSIPSWIQNLSAFIPLTYGLKALRLVLLEGLPLTNPEVARDLGMLVLFIAVLTAIGAALLAWAFRYARRAGTMGQY